MTIPVAKSWTIQRKSDGANYQFVQPQSHRQEEQYNENDSQRYNHEVSNCNLNEHDSYSIASKYDNYSSASSHYDHSSAKLNDNYSIASNYDNYSSASCHYDVQFDVRESDKDNYFVRFDVGGKLFRVSKALIDNHEGTLLHCLVLEKFLLWQQQMQKHNIHYYRNHQDSLFTIRIDRDAEYFRHVLHYMRYGKVNLPSSISKGAFLKDMEYYGIFLDDDKINKVRYTDFSSTCSESQVEEFNHQQQQALKLTPTSSISTTSLGTQNSSTSIKSRNDFHGNLNDISRTLLDIPGNFSNMASCSGGERNYWCKNDVKTIYERSCYPQQIPFCSVSSSAPIDTDGPTHNGAVFDSDGPTVMEDLNLLDCLQSCDKRIHDICQEKVRFKLEIKKQFEYFRKEELYLKVAKELVRKFSLRKEECNLQHTVQEYLLLDRPGSKIANKEMQSNIMNELYSDICNGTFDLNLFNSCLQKCGIQLIEKVCHSVDSGRHVYYKLSFEISLENR